MSRSKKLFHHLKNFIKLDPDLIGVDTKPGYINNKLMGKSVYILLIVILMAISGFIGFFVGSSSISKPQFQTTTAKKILPSDPFFNYQSATAQGEITSIKGNNIEIKNLQGQTGQYTLAKNISIYNTNASNSPSLVTSDLNSIKLNKKVLVIFELKDNAYQVISITFLPK